MFSEDDNSSPRGVSDVPRTGRDRARGSSNLLKDIFYVARRERKLWMTPFILLLLLFAALFAIATLAGPVGSFIYPLL
jgi:hypothetical protein